MRFHFKMNNIFVFATIISIVFFISKFIEMRFVEKESKPLKLLIRDTLLVYFAVIVGNFLIDQLMPVMNLTDSMRSPVVFTDNPEF
jgi:hypothetical protein